MISIYIAAGVGACVFTSTTKEPPFWARRMRALRIPVAPAIPVLCAHELVGNLGALRLGYQKSELGKTGVTGSSCPMARPNSSDTPVTCMRRHVKPDYGHSDCHAPHH